MLAIGIEHLASWVVVLTFVLSIVGGAGAVFATIRHGARSETVKLQREEIEALRQRNDTLDTEKRETGRMLAEQQGQIRALKAELGVLREMVTQAAKVDQLRAQIDALHDETMSALSDVSGSLKAMTAVRGGQRATDPPGTAR